MLEGIEDWLMNKFAGKMIARGAVGLAGLIVTALASPKPAAILSSLQAHGVDVPAVNGDWIAMALTGLGTWAAHSIFEWVKARRMANPNSPTVQTDKSKLPE